MRIDIEDIGRTLAAEGYDNTVEWMHVPDCTIARERDGEDTKIMISDYLKRAPRDALIRELEWMLSADRDALDRPKELIRYCLSEQFAAKWQSTYLSRKGLTAVKIVDGVAFVSSRERELPSWNISLIFRVVGCRPEWMDDEDIQFIAVQGMKNHIRRMEEGDVQYR